MIVKTYKPALLVIDVQEDFLPPNGALAVKDGRKVIPIINELMELPAWSTVIGSLDWHPWNHVSFASNHGEDTKPFTKKFLPHPKHPHLHHKKEFTLWPDHCIQDTWGSQFSHELEKERICEIIKKGFLVDREYYSAFEDVWGLDHTALEQTLHDAHVTDVFIVGLAFDYCVFHTAIDAAKRGFNTYIIREATKAVDPAKDEETTNELKKHHVKVITLDGPEVAHVRAHANDEFDET